jgi:hypothetical protein
LTLFDGCAFIAVNIDASPYGVGGRFARALSSVRSPIAKSSLLARSAYVEVVVVVQWLVD